MRDKELRDHLNELVGHKCEGVDNPLGSVLRLDIGARGLGPHDGPNSEPHGWRHLTIESPWRLENRREVLCDWNLSQTDAAGLKSCIAQLAGQTIRSVEAELPGCDLRLSWSNDLKLIVFADTTEDRDDAWFILGTDGLELTAGPTKGTRSGWRARWVK